MEAAEKEAILARITISSDIQDIKDCDLVIEAATENATIKKAIFKELDEVCDEKTILASNTSSLSITEIGAATKRPAKVIGMHFFNPVPMMKLVEVINGKLTDRPSRVAHQQPGYPSSAPTCPQGRLRAPLPTRLPLSYLLHPHGPNCCYRKSPLRSREA